MRRHEVRRFVSGGARTPYVLILQASDLSSLQTLIVAPVRSVAEHHPIDEINVSCRIGDQGFVIQIHDRGAVRKSLTGERITDLSHKDYEITRALDLLLFGV